MKQFLILISILSLFELCEAQVPEHLNFISIIWMIHVIGKQFQIDHFDPSCHLNINYHELQNIWTNKLAGK